MSDSVQIGTIVAGAVAAALVGLAIVRRLVPAAALKPHTDVAAAIYAALGVVYGVILGQVVVAAWSTFQAAESATVAEASSLVNLTRLADAFPEPARSTIRQDVIAYGRAVIQDEWPAMARRAAPSPRAAAAMARLYRDYTAQATGPIGPLQTYAESMTELDEADDARGDRLLASERGLPDLLWAVLLAAGVVTVAFSYLFGVENGVAHHLMVGALAGIVALLLVLAQALSTPFQSPLNISSDDYSRVLERAEPAASAPVASAIATPSPAS
ncbi:MAG TPA: hypothetical protein VFQ80_05595 [Thermomicrobiales bacterium]|jgi:hypothetical protein|nr:hypothetical protein [Thermomicrobiales bacterium]